MTRVDFVNPAEKRLRVPGKAALIDSLSGKLQANGNDIEAVDRCVTDALRHKTVARDLRSVLRGAPDRKIRAWLVRQAGATAQGGRTAAA